MTIKNSPPTIYHCLSLAFWLQRKCHTCQQFFTKADYAQQNYQLYFQEMLKVEQNCLQIMVQLTHQSCCSACPLYLKDLYRTCPNPANSTN